VAAFRRVCKISYSKVVEFQARGVIHVHVPIRLDGPDGPDGPAPHLTLTTADLEEAIKTAAARVRVDSAPLDDGRVYQLRWGTQVDTRTISHTADRDTPRGVPVVNPEQVASYLAKYLTKATEDFGLPARVRSAAHAHIAGASRHAVRIIATAQDLAAEGEGYGLLLSHLGTLGYRGHPITKSRAYSVTFGQIRRARRRYRSNPAGLAPEADIRQVLDDDQDIPEGFALVSSWMFDGQGYLDMDQAAGAVEAAARARMRRQHPAPTNNDPRSER
jgi:hypothetical protein